ncbi:hypothetical protein AB0C76_04090 [Kitasatospora sp. NPDC048722]|uniref:hypothetical protein n=1 Tax=Kitasatospora sp. NPDC048722 TaxID=3155639 RepID=UPI003410F2FD
MDIHETVRRRTSPTVAQEAAQDDPIGAIRLRPAATGLLARRAELMGTRDRGKCTIETVTFR